MSSSAKSRLKNLVKIGQLKEEPGEQSEYDGLLSVAIPRLSDAGNTDLSLESRFDLAKRNNAEYSGIVAIDEATTQSLISLAGELLILVKALGPVPG